MTVDDRTMAVDGQTMAVDGQTMAVDGRIMASDRNFYISAFRLKSSTLNLQYDFQQKCFISKLLISENP